jgi:hypothetical protein
MVVDMHEVSNRTRRANIGFLLLQHRSDQILDHEAGLTLPAIGITRPSIV